MGLCRECRGDHLTVRCPARHQPPEQPHSSGPQRPAQTSDWIVPQHNELLDLLEKGPGELKGPDRDFVLEGVRQGSYGNARDHRTPFTADCKVEVGEGYKLFIDDKLMHHGSLWTTKDLGSRHREHVKNCVKDSEAWAKRATDIPLPDVVERFVQAFGEYEDVATDKKFYYRLHGRNKSVKIFVNGKSCEHCLHCDAYEFLNELLECTATHGPKSGWAAEDLRSRLQRGWHPSRT